MHPCRAVAIEVAASPVVASASPATPAHPRPWKRWFAGVVMSVAAGCLGVPQAAQAQSSLPIPAPAARSYAGTIALRVDATDLDHRLFRVHETLPVSGSRVTLLYPRWLPGHHGPYGDVGNLAGLIVRGAGRPLPWMRDTLDPQAFHVELPGGVNELELEFQHVAATAPGQGLMQLSPDVIGVEWNQLVLYPAGHAASFITVRPSLRLPADWRHGSALVAERSREGWVDFAPVSLETLVDSPVYAGRHHRRVELDAAGAAQPVALHLFGDDDDMLKASDEQIDAHRKLVQQADRLFGARQYNHYDFLFVQSQSFGATGLEHHQSSENAVKPGYFKDWAQAVRHRELLPHEYVHSWNGKFRRPADLDTPNFNVPMRNSLLWVYEGMTEYWGRVLAARAALVTPEQSRDLWARQAAFHADIAGRAWRSLQDTTNTGTLGSERGGAWYDWQRGWDYYSESTLLWLDVDTLIRERSGDARSLDDVARRFFGVPGPRGADGAPRPLTYTFDDVVAALNAVQPHDWAKFLRERLDRTGRGPGPLLDGLARSGWSLEFVEQQSEFAKNDVDPEEGPRHALTYSLGLRIGKEGKLTDVAWEGPAFKAGLAPGMQVVAVHLQAYKPEVLDAAITANKSGARPIELLVKDGERYRPVTLDYRGGLRYPKLVRIEGSPDRLTQILSAR